MFTGKTVFAQLMSLIPRRDFNTCVARYKGDYRSRNHSCYDQFLVMCLAQYASKNSLRDIEASLIAVEHKLLSSINCIIAVSVTLFQGTLLPRQMNKGTGVSTVTLDKLLSGESVLCMRKIHSGSILTIWYMPLTAAP